MDFSFRVYIFGETKTEIMDIIKTEFSKELEFEIIGAGSLRISESNKCKCGGKEGFYFGVSWTESPFIGGVISNDEAIKLAEHILKETKVIDL